MSESVPVQNRGARTAAPLPLILALLFVHPSLLPAGQEPHDWPRWRGADFDGTSREGNVFPDAGFELRVRWREKVGSGYSGVVVAAGRAVTLSSDGVTDFLVALDADSGRERWRYPIAPTFPGREGANDGPVSTPAIAEGVVYALGPRGDLVSVHLESGRALWRVQLVDDLGADVPHWGFGTSPLVVGDAVVVETGGSTGSVTALDKRTGSVRWSAGSGATEYQSPILWSLGGREQVVGAAAEWIYGLDPVDGRELWRHRHEGQAFYKSILNPVAAGPGKLFLVHDPDGSELISVVETSANVLTARVWTTPHIKRNYSTPIYFEGHIYGFSGNFLSSIDAATGASNWKSRPPGNGFPILVDGHLVVLTKEGSLHVARASPEAYLERARLETLPHITWTPPAFARGRIYVRDSFEEVAAVDVVPGASTTEGGGASGPSGLVPGTRFERWLRTLEVAADKEERIRRFLATESFPLIENERVAHFVYVGEARDVAIRGGMLGAKKELSMHRVPGTDFFHASFELPREARLQYQLVPDFEGSTTDPLNRRTSDSLVYPGEVSLLLMPAAEPSVPDSPPRGRVEPLSFRTNEVLDGPVSWGGERSIEVYLPPGYDDDADRRFETLYVLYGAEMRRSARLSAVLDALIGRAVRPVVAVFVSSTSGYEYARSQRDDHARMLVNELVPLVDRKFRTVAEESSRALLGVDEGGFAAFDVAFRYPGCFGKVAAQSILAIGKGGEELLRAIEASPPEPLDIYLDWGSFDHSNDATETDIPGFSRRLHALLESKGYRVSGREWRDSSDLAIWGFRAPHLLRALFPLAGPPAE